MTLNAFVKFKKTFNIVVDIHDFLTLREIVAYEIANSPHADDTDDKFTIASYYQCIPVKISLFLIGNKDMNFRSRNSIFF